MVGDDLSVKEIEELDYYDFMSYLGVPFFHLGGLPSSEKLAHLCHIDKDKKILMVGCGSGFSACHIAKKFGCSVVGIDIAQMSIKKAKERAEKENIGERVEFIVADAYNLPFDINSFDAVITEFVSQFLDKDRSFREFARVLRSGGYVGINEMYKESGIPSGAAGEIEQAEQIFSEITRLPFKIHTPDEWKQWFENAGLEDVQIHGQSVSISIKEGISWISSMGGFWNLFFLLLNMIKYTLMSKVIRNRFRELDRGKRILLRNRSTSKYVGYVLGVGKKI